jgi:GT2 family glycosyltransferase
VYVDSGSSDGSVEAARALGSTVVEIGARLPFTAARARNAGFERLLEASPALKYVYFVDGDCEVYEGWIDKACSFLSAHPEFAIVCGNRRERYPDRSIYNMLCDIEWRSKPLGETTACGGDAMMRADAFREVNGFRPDLICGEEPELCVRIRQKGGRIWHMDEDMTLHDAAIFHFSQWWEADGARRLWFRARRSAARRTSGKALGGRITSSMDLGTGAARRHSGPGKYPWLVGSAAVRGLSAADDSTGLARQALQTGALVVGRSHGGRQIPRDARPGQVRRRPSAQS